MATGLAMSKTESPKPIDAAVGKTTQADATGGNQNQQKGMAKVINNAY